MDQQPADQPAPGEGAAESPEPDLASDMPAAGVDAPLEFPRTARNQGGEPIGIEQRLAALYRQWRSSGRPTRDAIVLLRTVAGSPSGLPALALLGVDEVSAEDAWAAWDGAQVASDATPVGRELRPLVCLVPARGRWTAGRSIGESVLLEPVEHPTPAQALSAAEARLGLVAAGRVGDRVEADALEALAVTHLTEPGPDAPADSMEAK